MQHVTLQPWHQITLARPPPSHGVPACPLSTALRSRQSRRLPPLRWNFLFAQGVRCSFSGCSRLSCEGGEKSSSNTFPSGLLISSHVPQIRRVYTESILSVNHPFSFIMKNIHCVYAATAHFCSLGERGSQESDLGNFSSVCLFGKYVLSSCCVPGPVSRAWDVTLKEGDEGPGLGNSRGRGSIRRSA